VLFASVLEAVRQLVAHLVADRARHADAARLSQTLKARRHVYAVAVYVAAVENDIAEVDPNPKLDPLIGSEIGVGRRHLALNFDRTLNRIHDAGELHERTVARGFTKWP
jgi:hypothetical protein